MCDLYIRMTPDRHRRPLPLWTTTNSYELAGGCARRFRSDPARQESTSGSRSDPHMAGRSPTLRRSVTKRATTRMPSSSLNTTPSGQWEPRDQIGGFDCYSSTEGSVLARFVQTPTAAPRRSDRPHARGGVMPLPRRRSPAAERPGRGNGARAQARPPLAGLADDPVASKRTAARKRQRRRRPKSVLRRDGHQSEERVSRRTAARREAAMSSPRAGSTPSSGSWVGGGCSDSRGAFALPPLPPAGYAPS